MARMRDRVNVRLALRGALATPTSDGATQFERDGVLLACEAGRILYVGPASRARALYRGPVQDVRPAVILPGFVDAHTHYPQTRVIGRATGPLLDWLDTSVFPEEARFRRSAYARQVAGEFIARSCACGTTTVGVFSSSHERATDVLFEQLADHGLRAVVGLALMDQHCPTPVRVARVKAMKACGRLVRRWHGYDNDRLRFAVTPRFALSCSRAMLRDAGRLAREHDLPIQTHIAETPREEQQTLQVHRYADSYLGIYERAGLLTERTVLAHAIHLAERDWNRIATLGASVVHCPDSNFFLGSGRMRLKAPLRRGIPVALGSDIAAGRSFSMRRAMASAYDNAMCRKAPIEPSRLLHMATLGGAEALGCAQVTGSLEPGKDADLIVVPLPNPAKTLETLLAQLIFDTDTPQVTRVYLRAHRLQ